MGLFEKTKKIKEIEFPIFKGDYPFEKEITESKFAVVSYANVPYLFRLLVKEAEEGGYDAITNLELMYGHALYFVSCNMIKLK